MTSDITAVNQLSTVVRLRLGACNTCVRKYFDLVGGWGDVKFQLVGVGKLIGWSLELNFIGQVLG